jgi:hypothetical protein
MATFWFVC